MLREPASEVPDVGSMLYVAPVVGGCWHCIESDLTSGIFLDTFWYFAAAVVVASCLTKIFLVFTLKFVSFFMGVFFM